MELLSKHEVILKEIEVLEYQGYYGKAFKEKILNKYSALIANRYEIGVTYEKNINYANLLDNPEGLNYLEKIFISEVEVLLTRKAIYKYEYDVFIKQYKLLKKQRLKEYNLKKKKEKDKEVSENKKLIMLLSFGVFFIFLSTIIFSTTNWMNLNGIMRLVVIAFFAVFLFSIHLLAMKILKLPKTGFAFLVLAAYYLPAALYTISHFSLLGDFLGINGDGKYLYFFIASLGCTLFYFFNSNKYKSIIFTISYYITANLACLSLIFIFNFNIYINILIYTIYSALTTAVYYLLNNKKLKLFTYYFDYFALAQNLIATFLILFIRRIDNIYSFVAPISALLNFLSLLYCAKYLKINKRYCNFLTILAYNFGTTLFYWAIPLNLLNYLIIIFIEVIIYLPLIKKIKVKNLEYDFLLFSGLLLAINLALGSCSSIYYNSYSFTIISILSGILLATIAYLFSFYFKNDNDRKLIQIGVGLIALYTLSVNNLFLTLNIDIVSMAILAITELFILSFILQKLKHPLAKYFYLQALPLSAIYVRNIFDISMISIICTALIMIIGIIIFLLNSYNLKKEHRQFLYIGINIMFYILCYKILSFIDFKEGIIFIAPINFFALALLNTILKDSIKRVNTIYAFIVGIISVIALINGINNDFDNYLSLERNIWLIVYLIPALIILVIYYFNHKKYPWLAAVSSFFMLIIAFTLHNYFKLYLFEINYFYFIYPLFIALAISGYFLYDVLVEETEKYKVYKIDYFSFSAIAIILLITILDFANQQFLYFKLINNFTLIIYSILIIKRTSNLFVNKVEISTGVITHKSFIERYNIQENLKSLIAIEFLLPIINIALLNFGEVDKSATILILVLPSYFLTSFITRFINKNFKIYRYAEMLMTISLTTILFVNFVVFGDIRTVVLLATITLIMFIIGFIFKFFNYFIVGFVTTLVIIIISLKDISAQIWWLYLLIGGIILISLAAAEEYSKTRQKSILKSFISFLKQFK